MEEIADLHLSAEVANFMFNNFRQCRIQGLTEGHQPIFFPNVPGNSKQMKKITLRGSARPKCALSRVLSIPYKSCKFEIKCLSPDIIF